MILESKLEHVQHYNEVVVSPGIDPGYIIFLSQKNNNL